MSSLNLFQQFVEQEALRGKMELTNPITAILDYLQYLIRTDFNINDKAHLLKKNRKSQINKQFRSAITTLSRQQKIYYYCTISKYLFQFCQGNFEPPKAKYTGMLNAIGYSRSFNIKRWKQKKLRFDLDKHLMFAQRQQKIKSYDLRNYILRRSKNKDYHCFVLEAINNIPHEKSMTVHIGFNDENRLNQWLGALRFSVDYRQWEFYLHMYQTSGQYKSMSARMFASDQMMYTDTISNFGELGAKKDLQREDQKHHMSRSMIEVSSLKREEKIERIKPGEMILTEELKMPVQRSLPKKEQTEEVSSKLKEKEKLQQQIKNFELQKNIQKTIVDQLIDGQVFEEPDVFEEKIEEEPESVRQHKRHLDLFHKLYPEYQLEELQIFGGYELAYEQKDFRIYQHSFLERRIKLLTSFDKSKYSIESILSMLSKPETAHLYNDNIECVQLKTYIPSQNSALMYQLNKPYNRLYRARDFVFIRHVFSSGSNVYMVDKSIENANYPPFMTIVRGDLCNVYGLFLRKDRIDLIADFQIANEGILNPVQQTNLSLKSIKGYLKMFETPPQDNSYKFFQLDWDISKNKANQIQNEIRSRRKTINKLQKDLDVNKEEPTGENPAFNKKSHSHVEIGNTSPAVVQNDSDGFNKIKAVDHEIPSNNSSPHSKRELSEGESPVRQKISPQHAVFQSPKKVEVKRFNQQTMEEVGELKQSQIDNKNVSSHQIVNQLNSQGLVVIRQDFRTHKYILGPLKDVPKNIIKGKSGLHPLWKDEWIHNDKEGGLIFIHKKKIEDQKGVLKFVLGKIAKNLVSGQSITSISLPVDIFSPESNLQRFILAMTYAPVLLQGLQNQNPINRLLRTFVFGLTNSVMYLGMEKPFNPILGQTFQCWMNGCPAYAEQISHHPPIAALILKGRGYQITGHFESIVSLGMNSGTGYNDGIYRVTFDDGLQICFVTPGGQISGLTAGDRKFNLSAYYWIQKVNIVVEITYDPFKKGVFSFGKQEKPSDYFEGTIWEVKPEFFTKFLGGKRKEPDQKDRLKNHGKISGIWNKYVCFNGNQIFSFDRQLPVVLQYENKPLPSDANWREDIEYRRRNQIPRAQTEKERLEVLQRKDRKLREKEAKKKK